MGLWKPQEIWPLVCLRFFQRPAGRLAAFFIGVGRTVTETYRADDLASVTERGPVDVLHVTERSGGVERHDTEGCVAA